MFNLFEGTGGVGSGEAEVAGLIESLGCAMTGSPAECLSLVRHKARTKRLLAAAGVPTPEFVLVEADAPLELRSLADLLAAGPMIVKPAHEDASLGIGPASIVEDEAHLHAQLRTVRARYGAALVERFIVGREFNAAVLAAPDAELLPLAEIEFAGRGRPGWQIVTYDAKWTTESDAYHQTPAACPARLDADTAARAGQLALAAFRLTGCRDYARVDLRQDAAGRLFVLEVNANPDIGPSAGYARSLGVAHIEYDAFIDRLVRHAHATRGCQAARA